MEPSDDATIEEDRKRPTIDPELASVAIGEDDGHFPGWYNADRWERAGAALGDHARAWRLSFGRLSGVDRDCFRKFCAGLARNRSVTRLRLGSDSILWEEDRYMENLAPFLRANVNLRHLELGPSGLNEENSTEYRPFHLHHGGIMVLVKALKEFDTLTSIGMTDVVGLSGWYGCDRLAPEPFDAFRHHPALAALSFEGTALGRNGFTELGWLLVDDQCRLSSLTIHDRDVEGEYLGILATALAENSTLLEFNIGGCRYIPNATWRHLFASLLGSNSALERLRVENCLDDDDAVSLANVLHNNGKLKELSLANPAIGLPGWQAIFNVLHGSVSILEKLGLSCGNYLLSRDGAAIALATSLANSLANNDHVTDVEMSGFDVHPIAAAGWGAFSRVLCDASCVAATRRSNHTLRSIRCDGRALPTGLEKLLQTNRRNGKHQAVRLKIIEFYFGSGTKNTQALIYLNLGVLPHAISWAADCAAGGDTGRRTMEYSFLYRLAQSIPSLFDVDSRTKKRKTGNKDENCGRGS